MICGSYFELDISVYWGKLEKQYLSVFFYSFDKCYAKQWGLCWRLLILPSILVESSDCGLSQGCLFASVQTLAYVNYFLSHSPLKVWLRDKISLISKCLLICFDYPFYITYLCSLVFFIQMLYFSCSDDSIGKPNIINMKCTTAVLSPPPQFSQIPKVGQNVGKLSLK